MQPIPIMAASAELEAQAAQRAARWGFPLIAAPGAEPFRLVLTQEGLQLQAGDDPSGPIRVDFIGGAVGHRRRFGGGRGQALAKAAGLKGGAMPSVLDATAGLGRDAFVLATLGCAVTLVERSAVVAALVEDGLARAAGDAEVAPIAARMQLRCGDAREVLAQITQETRPEVIYLDPMYPHRNKSALVKKEMRLFRELVGEDEDAQSLLPLALAAARRRVVVKRPDYAEPLGHKAPTMAIATKNHRFDVYVIKALNP